MKTSILRSLTALLVLAGALTGVAQASSANTEAVPGCPDDIVVSNYVASGSAAVEIGNVAATSVSLDGCSLVAYNVMSEVSTAAVALTGSLAPGDTVQFAIDLNVPFGALGIYDAPPPPDGTPFTTDNEVTGLVYLSDVVVFGVSHLTKPELDAVYECIYGGSGTGPFTDRQPFSSCVEPPPTPLFEVNVDPACSADLVLTANADTPFVAEGELVNFSTSTRNDPVGSCYASSSAPATIAGSVEFSASAVDPVELASVAMWLEIPGGAGGFEVLPLSSGLTTDGGPAPAGCPGETASGCEIEVGDTVGFVSIDGAGTVVVPGEPLILPFRYFPSLESADVAVLQSAAGGATLAVAVIDVGGEISVVRSGVTFGEAAATPSGQIVATLPTGDQQVVLPPIVAGGQVDQANAFSFVAGAATPDVISAVFVASAGGVVSAPATVDVFVTVGADDLPDLQPGVWPQAVKVMEATAVQVSVKPKVPIAGSVTIDWPGGSIQAEDNGAGGDQVAGDGVWSAEFDLVADAVGTVEITASASATGGGGLTGTTQITVVEADMPTEPESGSELMILEDAGSRFLADRIMVITADDATPAQVSDAAAAVGGQLVGFVGPGVWQIAVNAVSSLAELEAYLADVSVEAGIIGAQPEFVGEADTVEPDDTDFGDQTNITSFGLDDGWTFEHGGDSSVIVAVIDSGVNLSHPDLDSKLLAGRDFREGDDDPNDEDCLHGTHVAGIIGAESDNGAGIAGVNWGAQILPLKVFPDDPNCGSFRYGDVAAAIDFAVAEGAAVMNMSLSGQTRSEDVARSLDRALDAGRFAVATSGNTMMRERRYPSGFERSERFTSWFGLFPRTYTIDILSVGNVQDDKVKRPSSTWGPWVDIVGPGTSVLSTYGDGDLYEELTGTSMAAPFVAGVLSLMVAQDPTITPGDGRVRLQSTGEDSGDPEHGPIIDAYQALSDGSFESSVSPWADTGTVSSVRSLGPIVPRDGDQMLSVSSGPGGAVTTSTASIGMDIPGGALDEDQLTITLWYNYVTEEYPEFVGTIFNDSFTVDVVLPDGTRMSLVDEAVNTTAWTPVSGIDFPGGDTTVGQSGWRFAFLNIDAAMLDGQNQLNIEVSDRGDSIYDSVGLIDSIRVG